MKRKFAFLLLIPALTLSGCSTLNNLLGKLSEMVEEQSQSENDEEQKEYAQTVKIDASQKGETITYSEAKSQASDINNEIQNRSRRMETAEGRQELIEDTDKFSYKFKLKMDDTSVYNYINYSQSDKYFGGIADNTMVTQNDAGEKRSAYTHSEVYEYLAGDSFVQASKHHTDGYYYDEDSSGWVPANSDYAYYRYVNEDVYSNDILVNLCDLIILIGNRGKDYMQQMEPYFNETYTGSGMTAEYSSKGAGHLYGKINMPSYGVTFEFLYEDYWITYEYMHIDMRKMQSMIGDMADLGGYKQMSTELYMSFNTVDIQYPNLDSYEYQR